MKLQGLVKVCAAMLFCLGNQQLKAQQLKLGTNPSLTRQSAILELESKKQALLITRIADTNQIISPVNGMIIYLESDNTFRVRANNYWNKMVTDAAIKSINGDITPAQKITAVNTAGTFGFASAAGTHTLTIPDASIAAAGFVNLAAQSFKGVKTFTDGLYTKSLRITDDVSTPIKILGKDGTGDVASLSLDNNLSITAGQLGVKNTVAAWNANKLSGFDLSFPTATPPQDKDVLTFNGTQWIAKAPSSAGSVTSVTLTMPSLFSVAGSPVTGAGTLGVTLANQAPNTVFAGPATGSAAGVPGFRALTTADLPANAYILNTTTAQTGASFNIAGAGTIGQSLTVTGAMRLVGSAGIPTSLLGRAANGDVSNMGINSTTLSVTTGVLGANNTTAVWNAGQLQGKAIAPALNPANGQVLKWNTTTSLFEAADDITGGASYGNLTGLDLKAADAPDDLYRMKIWKGPGNGVVQSGPLGTTANAWSVLSFRNVNFTTQLYFDKNTLALKEWGGNASPLTSNTGNPWYKVVVTHGDNIFTDGGVMFAQKTSDASAELKEDYANFFWDYPNKKLGLGTNAPANTLDVKKATLPGTPTNTTSGLRLSNLAGLTGEAPNANVLSVNSLGDVILTKNPANNNWLTTGNPGASPSSFLGTTDDVAMTIGSNNQPMLQFGRRARLGLTQDYDGYRDDNQNVTLLKSALQFDAPGADFYKPMFFVNSDGNFRMKGSSAGTDYFEFGSTGVSNNGGFDFIVGDDGDEPIIFKYFNYQPAPGLVKEMVRMQSGRMGVGVSALPNSTLQVNGSISTNIRTITANTSFTLAEDDHTIIVNTPVPSSGATITMTVTVPAATAANKGRIYVVKRINVGTRLIVNLSSTSSIDGSTQITTTARTYQIQSDGVTWWIIN